MYIYIYAYIYIYICVYIYIHRISPPFVQTSVSSKVCMCVDVGLQYASILKGWSDPKAERLYRYLGIFNRMVITKTFC